MKQLSTRRLNLDRDTNDAFADIVAQVNALSEGQGVANYNATDTMPTRLIGYANGDFIAKKTKSELGLVGSKYVLQGWDLVDVVGTLTWKERRTLTGN